MTYRSILACALALPLAGCATGQDRFRITAGLSLLGVPLVTLVDVQHEHLDAEALAAGGRISTAAPPVPVSILGMGRGVHAIRLGPDEQDVPEPVPADEGAAPGAEAGAHRTDPRARH